MFGQTRQKSANCGTESSFFASFSLAVAFGVDVHAHRQPAVEDALDRVIERTQTLGTNGGRTIHGKQGLRIHAQPHVIETPGLHERNVLRGDGRFEGLWGVTLRTLDLRKPSAGMDAVLQTGRAALANTQPVRRGGLRRQGSC